MLPEAAHLASLEPAALLIPGALPGLWQRAELSVGALRTYFSGGHVVQVKKDGYEEPRVIPGAEPSVVDAAIRVAVQTGKLWLVLFVTRYRNRPLVDDHDLLSIAAQPPAFYLVAVLVSSRCASRRR